MSIQIYALCDEGGTVRYIGKANNAERRYSGHLRDAGRRATPVYNWIRGLLGENKVPSLVVLASVIGDDWQSVERGLIAQYRADGVRLLNLAAGGDEPFQTPEQRAEAARKAVIARTIGPNARVNRVKHDMGILIKNAKRDGRFDSPHWRVIRAKLRYVARKRPDLFALYAKI